MSDAFQIKVEIKDNVRAVLGPMLDRAVEESVAAVARELRNQVLLNLTGRVLKVRSRALRDSWSGMPEVHKRGTETTATIGSQGVPYAAIHEWGGTVRAQKGRLAIPLDAMRMGSGAARARARDVIANPGAYGFAGTFTAKNVIFGKLGKSKTGKQKMKTVGRGEQAQRQSFVPLFALKESATIPARRYISLAVSQASARAEGVVNAAIMRVVRDVAGGGAA